jgi:MFS transporter, DHA1 family, inner membrane transport protein
VTAEVLTESPDVQRLDRNRVRLAFLAMMLGGVALGTTEFASLGLLPEIARGVGESIPTTSAIVSAYALGVVVGAPLFAVLGARLPRKTLLLALLAGILVTNAWSALAPGFTSLVAARFAAGLPHGTYFGIAVVLAASFVAPERRGRAIAVVMSGLTFSMIVGVPLSTFLGQRLGWQSAFWAVTVIAVASVAMVAALVPQARGGESVGVAAEVAALRRPQVWFSLGVIALGFAGVFAVYSFVAPVMTEVAHLSEGGVPLVLALFGLGATIGNLVGGRLAEWSVDGSIAIGFAITFAVLVTMPLTAHHAVTGSLAFFLLAFGGFAVNPGVTTRILDAAGKGQSLAAALVHSAFNLANALGAFVGAQVIDAGLGWTAPALAGAAFALGGLGVLLLAVAHARRDAVRTAQVAC